MLTSALMRVFTSRSVMISALSLMQAMQSNAALPPKDPEKLGATMRNPEEVGTVAWGRDLDAALLASKKSKKPVFALFQEVPGCAGCKQFGKEVMAHPLIAEAVEDLFTPLLIHNSKGGKDAAVLHRYGEPAFNYQVVRFLDENGRDIIPRKDKVWTTSAVAARMIAALETAGRPVPDYLRILTYEKSDVLKLAAFAMACFWTGEKELGAISGVVHTETGFIDGKEVTRVSYDPEVIRTDDLIAAAEKVQCAQAVYLPSGDSQTQRTQRLRTAPLVGYRKAPASDQLRQIQGTPLASLDLHGVQATKVNAWIRSDPQRALALLSPKQRLAIGQK